MKPCPFCGGTKTLRIVSSHEDEEYFDSTECFTVSCDASSNGPGGCGAACGYQRSKEKAVEAWNTRAEEPPEESLNVDELRENGL